jgi:prepilin-type N-terminal cleavage/methylation domain-containing protein
MKFSASNSNPARQRATRGFTLVEIMITAAIFVMIVAAMVAVQIYGLRVYTLAATKLTATTGGRETLNDIRDKIRGAKTVNVGIYTNGAFSIIPFGQPLIGNAIQIAMATNGVVTNTFIFYMDPAHTNMSEINNGVVSVEANYMTNYYCFQSEFYQGGINTNNNNNSVIHVTMQFYQWEYPIGFIGSGGSALAENAYDYYVLQTRITRRSYN